jgi:carboxypeptidase T
MEKPNRSRALLVAFFTIQMFLASLPISAAGAPVGDSRTPSYTDEWWSKYHSTADVYDLINKIAKEHSDIVKLITIGTTVESRPLVVIKVSANPGVDDPTKPDVLIMAGTHAREWTTYHAAAYFLNWITGHYRRTADGALEVAAPGELDNESLASWLIDNREIYILPMVNPDGIEYTFTTDNNWRKNREPNPGVTGLACTGTDINRNFDWHWGELQGDSHNPCSETYAGPLRADGLSGITSWRPGETPPGAFSTREARAIRDLELAHNFQVALSFHSFSGLVLYPWGNTPSPAPDYTDLSGMAAIMGNQTGYTAEQGYSLYKTAGVWDDWSYGVTHAYSFTIEMGQAFQPPVEEIINQSKLVFGPELFLATAADDLHLHAPTVEVFNPASAEVDPNSPTTVTARVDAIDGLDGGGVSLVYSRDGGKTWEQVPMAQQGSDTTFKGSLPGLRPGASLIYYVSATDSNGITRSGPMPAPYQALEVHARNGILDQIGMFGLIAILGGAGLAGALLYVKFLRGRPLPALPSLKLPKFKIPRRSAGGPRAKSPAAAATAVVPPRDGRPSADRLQAFIDSVGNE